TPLAENLADTEGRALEWLQEEPPNVEVPDETAGRRLFAGGVGGTEQGELFALRIVRGPVQGRRRFETGKTRGLKGGRTPADRHRDANVETEEIAGDLVGAAEDDPRDGRTRGEERRRQLLGRSSAHVTRSPEEAVRRLHPVVGEFDGFAAGIDL